MPENKKQKKQSKKADGGCQSSCCKWFFGSFLLFGAIAGLIAYDTNVLNGGVFENSSVGRVLKQTGKFAWFHLWGQWPSDIETFFLLLIGALPHVENAWFVSLKYSARGYKWTAENAPIAYEKSKTFLQPYGEFAKDLGITLFNTAVKGWEATKIFASEKTPIVLEWIDQKVPGVGQKISDITSNTYKGFCSITSNGWRSSVDFFKTKVFV